MPIKKQFIALAVLVVLVLVGFLLNKFLRSDNTTAAASGALGGAGTTTAAPTPKEKAEAAFKSCTASGLDTYACTSTKEVPDSVFTTDNWTGSNQTVSYNMGCGIGALLTEGTESKCKSICNSVNTMKTCRHEINDPAMMGSMNVQMCGGCEKLKYEDRENPWPTGQDCIDGCMAAISYK